jgi:5'-deoxynucleotidase YfbR-like HD superfamily hydrolase
MNAPQRAFLKDLNDPGNDTGPLILTVGGRTLDVHHPLESAFDIEDIAHGLSNAARYNGHTRQFYSVAQHSVLVSHVVPPPFAFAGLLHDAAEAYLSDVAKPLKLLLPDYNEAEERVETVLLRRFGLPARLPPHIKEADVRLLVTEQRDLMPPGTDRWALEQGIRPLEHRIEPLPPEQARRQFLDRFRELAASVDLDAIRAASELPKYKPPSGVFKTHILTVSGGFFDFEDPDGNEYDIEDVAHALSNLCRFGGQSRSFYSIAQHCVLVSGMLPPALQYAGLMEKASKAFLGDMPKPLKDALPRYQEITGRLERSVANHFDLHGPLHPMVRDCAMRVLATECRDLMPHFDRRWSKGAEPLPGRIAPWSPEEAKERFLGEYWRLKPAPSKAPGLKSRRTRRVT